MTETLTLTHLSSAVAGGVAAFRVIQRLQPAGGPGDKLFPPTYATGDKLKYAMESRRVDGQTVPCVLVDSVASQANRMEEALLRAWEEARVDFPVIRIDFTGRDDIKDLDHISTLQAPHRAFDALLRDSVDAKGTLFRDTEVGRALTQATAKAATALYTACPTVLVFGGWDSTGPKGGMGTKVQRALVSEIVAINAQTGVKTASRLDPAGIQANVDVYHHKDNHDDYTIDPDEAEKAKGKPVSFSRKGAEGKGKPSAINHSNVAPSIDELAGGVTCDYALQTSVLSLPALRRLRFPTTAAGDVTPAATRAEAERAARTALAALGLAAMALLREDGFDLRSRCALVPDSPMVVEAVSADGSASTQYTLTGADAVALLAQAETEARKLGFGWVREPIRLVPSKKLGDLIAKSRELAAAGGAEEEGAA
jgi:CRISPR-associated protein Csb1